ncbi:HupE/UreJ family protein [Pseudophaeobacter leonis]|uniref:HupE/UreJ family protein n=1 Tax=Pseudophaeobacter leonis TaxID=1144477 RepID=UPI001F4DAE44|nr:HupE/UreJ family protein [Pseudophaeobacter leonis]
MLKTFLLSPLRVGILLILSSLVLFGLPGVGRSHEVTPTIADFNVEDGKISLKLRMNLEAFVAGIDLDGRANTDTSDKSLDYDLLRNMDEAELGPMARLFVEDWLPELQLEAGGAVALQLDSLTIPEIEDVSLARASYLTLTGDIPRTALYLKLTWPQGSGAVVLRQNGVPDPYTGYLLGGGQSPAIVLKGGAVQTPWQVFQSYVPVGFDHILPQGLDHILFVLGLFFLSLRIRPLLWQVTTFTVAHSITLALGALGLVSVNPAIVEPLIAASIVFVAVENIFARRLHSWRTLVIFGFGLLHGLGFATVLGEFGLPQDQVVPALLGFNVGVEFGQLAVIALAYGCLGYWFGGHPKYRGRVAIPASLTIALIGGYWFFERIPL